MGLEQYTVRIEKVPFPTASSEAVLYKMTAP